MSGDDPRIDDENYLGVLLDELVHIAQRVTKDAIVVGRVKSSASSREKAARLRTRTASLLDTLGVRIIVHSLDECHRVVDLLHLEFRRVFGEYDDYVQTPKENGYSSLHTTLLSGRGRPFEVPVRTQAMHAVAEGGAAAHEEYKRRQTTSAELER